MHQYVKPAASFVTSVDGRRVRIYRGGDPLPDTHPVVKKHPKLFRPYDDNESADTRQAVEDASAEPGSRRRMSRPPGKKTAATVPAKSESDDATEEDE